MWLDTSSAQASISQEHKLTASVSLTAKTVSTTLHVRGISRDRTHADAKATSLMLTVGRATTALPVVWMASPRSLARSTLMAVHVGTRADARHTIDLAMASQCDLRFVACCHSKLRLHLLLFQRLIRSSKLCM